MEIPFALAHQTEAPLAVAQRQVDVISLEIALPRGMPLTIPAIIENIWQTVKMAVSM